MLTSRHWHRVGVFALASSLVVAACSDDEQPTSFEVGDPVEVAAVETGSPDRWGTGYAVAAHPLGDDRSAVVTTAGIYVTDGTDVAPIEVEAFGGPTQVQTTAVSPDGSVLVVATSAPASVRWYDLVAGQPTAAIDVGLEGAVREFVFVETTDRLVAVTSSGLVSWDVAAPTAPVTQLAEGQIGPAASLDGQVAAPLLDTSDLILTDGITVDRRTVALPEEASLLVATASPDGGTLAVTSGVGPDEFDRVDSVNVVDLETMAPTAAAEADRPIRPNEVAVDSAVVAVADGAELTITSVTGEPVVSAAPLADDAIQSVLATDAGIVTVHQSGAVVAWRGDARQPEVLGRAELTTRYAESDGSELTTVDFDGGIATWGVDDNSRVDDPQFATGAATASAISTDGGQIAVATSAGITIVLDDGLAEQTRLVVEGRSPHIDTVEFNPRTAQIATGLAERLGEISFDDSVTLWDEETGAPSVTIGGEAEDVPGCGAYVNRIGFTPDGELLSTVSHDFSIAVHDGSTGDYIVTLEPFESTVLDTDFSISGDLLVASADDSSVRVWDTEDFELLASYAGPPGGLQAIGMLPDDNTMVASDLSGRLLLIDIMTGEILDELAELGSRTTALAVSDDGGIVAAPFSDSSVGLWSTTSGELLTTLTGHAGPITDVDFASEAEWIVTSSADGTIRKWDLDVSAAGS